MRGAVREDMGKMKAGHPYFPGRWAGHKKQTKEERNARSHKRHLERWANDPDYRERLRGYWRKFSTKRYHSDPDYRESQREWNRSYRQRYVDDPEFRERQREYVRKSRLKNREQYLERQRQRDRLRYAADPEYRTRHSKTAEMRERRRKYQREYHALRRLDPKYREYQRKNQFKRRKANRDSAQWELALAKKREYYASRRATTRITELVPIPKKTATKRTKKRTK